MQNINVTIEFLNEQLWYSKERINSAKTECEKKYWLTKYFTFQTVKSFILGEI